MALAQRNADARKQSRHNAAIAIRKHGAQQECCRCSDRADYQTIRYAPGGENLLRRASCNSTGILPVAFCLEFVRMRSALNFSSEFSSMSAYT